ncbi:cytochrome P450 [Russula compacta]|nr:cytochrome P450 [Russula compacta]
MAYLTLILDFFVVLLHLAALRAIRDYRRRSGLPYPPGPRPLPIIGNLLDIPLEFSWLTYTRFSRTYGTTLSLSLQKFFLTVTIGNILSFHVFGQVIVVLNSAKVAKDLLEKRGDIYPDRPPVPFYEMMKWEWLLPIARYDDRWRLGRRLLDRGLRPGAITSYRPMLQAKAHLLLSRLLANPHQWEAYLELFQGELTLAMTYGYDVQERDDTMIDAAKRMTKFGEERILPGALLVNHIPLLRHIPEWLPWFSYKPLARIGLALGSQVIYSPIQFVKEAMVSGSLKLSGDERDKTEEMIAGALGSIYASGADTTVSALMSFVVAMLLYPNIQKKAQDVLDSVTRRERLPTFEDHPRLPFIDAICKEVLRWRPVFPIGVPHASVKDDVYEGFFIPKGAVVIGNSWEILHDPAFYPEPDIFKPERFLNPDGTLRDDPMLISAFGFGKRICPGRHLVDATLFISVASLLSVFNLERERDGWDKPSDYTYTGTLIRIDGPSSHPNQFPCSFIRRDEKAQEIVLADDMAP